MGSFSKRVLGGEAEGLGSAYLKEQGWRIEARNWRCRLGEIDLVARKGKVLCFVEVKSRRSERFGTGLEAVTISKRRRLGRLAAAYCQSRRTGERGAEFGVLSILWSGGRPLIQFIRQAFEVEGFY